ncbi:Hypothetical protein D9617_5g071060 [Elsinoe fawcettii]|nr:Hypothetical protein D9617_5g071060 [Elsinoe fawcettii]
MVLDFDGQALEGGGQLVRTAVCLSALTGTGIRITDIRGKRPGGGGLKAQHLTCVQWLQGACGAKVEGAEKGSKTILFRPGRSKKVYGTTWSAISTADGGQGYETHIDIGSAGSTTLALQAVLPFALFSNRVPGSSLLRLKLSGGTNVPASPSFEYVKQVLLPTLSNLLGTDISATLHVRGWAHGPGTIGEFTVEFKPLRLWKISPFDLSPLNHNSQHPNPPSRLLATCVAPERYHNHFRDGLGLALKAAFDLEEDDYGDRVFASYQDSGHDKRLYLIVVAIIPSDVPGKTYRLGSDWLYDRKVRSHKQTIDDMIDRVSKDIASEWSSGAYVDKHMRDQLVVFQALAEGASTMYEGDIQKKTSRLREPDLHAQTTEMVCSQMLGALFDGEGGCEGIVSRKSDGKEEDILGKRLHCLQMT